MRIGVFGGTFDPPHVGHVAVANDAREDLGLDLVIFVPARVSPFKTDEWGITDPEVRLRMVRAAIEGEPVLEADRLELDRESPSYTVDTLRTLAGRYPDAELFLMLGTDQWSSFDRWKDPEGISELATIAVLAREGADPSEVDPGVHVTRVRANVRRMDVSSTEIRERIRDGLPVHSLVRDGVHELIEEHALYRAAPNGARQRTVSTC